MSEWISVKDKLPQLTEEIIVFGHHCNGKSSVNFASEIWIGNFWKSLDNRSDDVMANVNGAGFIVTHWMPLPEPPERANER